MIYYSLYSIFLGVWRSSLHNSLEFDQSSFEEEIPIQKAKTRWDSSVPLFLNKLNTYKFSHEEEPVVDEEGDNNLEMGENLDASDEEPDENIIEGGVNNFQKEFIIFLKKQLISI